MRTRRPRPLTFVWRSLVERAATEDFLTTACFALWSEPPPETAAETALADVVVVEEELVSDWGNWWRTTSELMLCYEVF